MAKISGSIPNFANGISQQAMALRLATQGDLQENAYSTVVDGLRKRPPTQRRAYLGAGYADKLHMHMINRDAVERYEVLMSSSGIRVFDLDGNEKTVNTPDGFGYLQYPAGHITPPYRTLTVGDHTFITNTSKTVALDETVIEPVSPSEAIVHVMAGNYGKDYKVMINGNVVAWYRTPDGTSAAQSPAVDTAFIARRLATGELVQLETTVNNKPNGDWSWKGTDTNLDAHGINAANGWTVRVTKGTIYIKRDDGTPFSIGVEDGYNGHAMKSIQTTVQDFSNLPGHCEEGMAIKVTGSVSTEYDDYHVRFGKQHPDDPVSTPGVWREVAAPGSVKAFNADTMPHVLVREEDGTFTFRKAVWDQRKAGDNTTVPPPSFVGRSISDLVFFKNRLGLLSGESVILSRSGAYFDYWRATATALLDDDPIDVAAGETNVAILRSALPFEDRLVIFADQTQFHLRGNELLTPKTASIRATTSYSMTSECRPVPTGDVVYFPAQRGQYAMIREYRVDGIEDRARADDATGHVPQYIPGTIIRMAGSTHEDVLFVQSDADKGALYVYKYFWQENTKLQASWSRWTFPGVDEVLDFTFLQSKLVLIVRRGEEVHIEDMDIQPGGVDPHAGFICHLDRRLLIEPVPEAEYDPFDDRTYVPMDISLTGGDYRVVTAGSPASPLAPGLEIELVSVGSDHLILQGDMRSVPFYIGVPYEMRYRLSTIFIRQESRGGGTSVITEGRLQLLQLLIQYSKTAYFRVEVTPLAQQTRPYFTNGRMMGDPENKVDRVHLSDGSFRVPILCRNDRVRIEVINDSYLPCSILSAEWVANYVNKSKRI